MNQIVKKSPLIGVGVSVGTLMYTGLLSAAREFDFTRAIFVGGVVALGAVLYYRQKQ